MDDLTEIQAKDVDCSVSLSGTSGCSSEPDAVSVNLDENANCLQKELDRIKSELIAKKKECDNLRNIRQKVESELEDLTVSLFEEANKMVYDANLSRHKMEKKLAESVGEIEALQTENEALKSLVLTSTPSYPNPTSHPQLLKKKSLPSPKRFSFRKHFNSISLSSPTETPTKKEPEIVKEEKLEIDEKIKAISKLSKQTDFLVYEEIIEWFESLPSLNSDSNSKNFCECNDDQLASLDLGDCVSIEKSDLLKRICHQDILPCLAFHNNDILPEITQCIHTNSLSVEALPHLEKPEKCTLSGVKTYCKHRIKLGENETWYPISQSSRNRITTVCDFFQYIRYLKQGILKHNISQMYAEVLRLRVEMTIARLGFY